MKLSQISKVGGSKACNCRKFEGLDAPNCETVTKLKGWRLQSVKLSQNSRVGGSKVCNRRKIEGLEATKCETVSTLKGWRAGAPTRAASRPLWAH